jgi:hypothetical protein
MKLEIEIDSDDAEMLVFACALRYRQKGLDKASAEKARKVGEKIAKQAGTLFGWDQKCAAVMFKKRALGIKSVNIRNFDIAPLDL